MKEGDQVFEFFLLGTRKRDARLLDPLHVVVEIAGSKRGEQHSYGVTKAPRRPFSGLMDLSARGVQIMPPDRDLFSNGTIALATSTKKSSSTEDKLLISRMNMFDTPCCSIMHQERNSGFILLEVYPSMDE